MTPLREYDDPVELITTNTRTPYQTRYIQVYTKELENQFRYDGCKRVKGLHITPYCPNALSERFHYVSYDISGSWIEVHPSTRFYLAPQKHQKKYVLCWKHGILGSINVSLSGFSTWLTFHANEQEYLKKEIWDWFQKKTLILPLPLDIWNDHILTYL